VCSPLLSAPARALVLQKDQEVTVVAVGAEYTTWQGYKDEKTGGQLGGSWAAAGGQPCGSWLNPWQGIHPPASIPPALPCIYGPLVSPALPARALESRQSRRGQGLTLNLTPAPMSDMQATPGSVCPTGSCARM
jgi:hypothetical protein